MKPGGNFPVIFGHLLIASSSSFSPSSLPGEARFLTLFVSSARAFMAAFICETVLPFAGGHD
jgi:hypothetical protein